MNPPKSTKESHPSKKALFIGINDYDWAPLQAPVEDAKKMEHLLSTHENGDPNFQCKVVVSTKEHPKDINQGSLTKLLKSFFKNEIDVLLFYFSGHGETDELGGYIQTKDATRNDPGIAFSTIIDLAIISPTKEIILIFDCCYSGAAANFGRFGRDITMLREGITILSASGSDQYALQVTTGTESNSLFTSVICEALKGGAADLLGNVTVASLYSFADQILSPYDQRPIYKSDVSRMIPIRSCHARITREILRRITKYFPDPSYQFPLSPDYEPDLEPKNPMKEAKFKDLQKYRAQSLLEPNGEEHMYYAAMNHKSCQLTHLGKFYWQMVKMKRI